MQALHVEIAHIFFGYAAFQVFHAASEARLAMGLYYRHIN
jgi:hypothetical protein